MKFFSKYLSVFVSLSLLLYATALTSKSLNSYKFEDKTLEKELLNDIDLSGMYWKQVFEPGKNPEKYLKGSERLNKYEYLRLDNDSLKFTPTKDQLNKVTDELNLHDIYDPDYDSVKDGKCCTRITYSVFPAPQCTGKCLLKNLNKVKPNQDQLERDPASARFCVQIFIPQQIFWRICHRNEDAILRLRASLSFGALKSIPGTKASEILKKFIQHSNNTPLSAPEAWNWHDQASWGGNCNNHIMQSPINVIAPVPGNEGSTSIDFKVEYKFEKVVPFYITNNSSEIVMKFTAFAGAFKITYNSIGAMLSYQPHTLAFRFPAEHLINGFRSDGEIVLLCDEIAIGNIKSYSLTNGMEFVIPLKFHPDAPELKEFSSLFPEMWRKEVDDDEDKEYRPRDAVTGKYVDFNLHNLMTKVMGLKADFSMYLGSQTTPPCKDHVLQIITNASLVLKDCQFKDIRENTLLTTQTKETHARELQFNQNGGANIIKNLKFAQFSYQGNLHNFTPDRKLATISVQIKHQNKKKTIKRKVALFASPKQRNGLDLEPTIQIPHYERLER